MQQVQAEPEFRQRSCNPCPELLPSQETYADFPTEWAWTWLLLPMLTHFLLTWKMYPYRIIWGHSICFHLLISHRRQMTPRQGGGVVGHTLVLSDGDKTPEFPSLSRITVRKQRPGFRDSSCTVALVYWASTMCWSLPQAVGIWMRMGAGDPPSWNLPLQSLPRCGSEAQLQGSLVRF